MDTGTNRGLVLLPARYEQVRQVLARLCRQAGASGALLADISGRLLCEAQTGPGPNLTVLAALAAGTLVATTEMGRLVGETEHFRTALYEGSHQSVHIASIGSGFLLAVVFDSSAPVGLVVLYTKQAVSELTGSAANFGALVGGDLSPDFGQALAEELERSLLG